VSDDRKILSLPEFRATRQQLGARMPWGFPRIEQPSREESAWVIVGCVLGMAVVAALAVWL
jgi:hypothetical protein